MITCRFTNTLLVLAAIAVSGCGQNEIRVYRVPKEQPAQAAPHDHDHDHDHQQASSQSGPPLTWQTPAGWVENPPSQFRVASFLVKSPDGKQADVSVIPLPGGAGGDFPNVNRWRGQVGLEPVSEEQFKSLGEPVTVAGQPATLYDLDGKSGDGAPTRILAAIQLRDGVSWFYKMTGDSALTEQEKPSFIGFLASVKFPAPGMPAGRPEVGSASTPAPAATTSSSGGNPSWSVPAGWKEVEGGRFLAAKFEVAGADNAQATVNVSTSMGDGGGLAANVNRWRGQLGLAPASADEIARMSMPVSGASGEAMLVEMGNDTTALVAVVVTLPGQSWFYKLMGDKAVVTGQKQAFIQFVQGAKY